jgi:hypothetical protein
MKMETRLLSELKPDPRNPRSITERSFNKLKKLLDEFGELNGIIENQTTGELVGGHARVEAFKQLGANPNIQITQRFETPTRTGTLAIGYVVLNGEPFNWRLVSWDLAKQKAGNIAANASADLAEWDNQKLEELVYDLSQLENGDEMLQLTALAEDDILKLLGQNQDDAEPSQDPDKNRLSVNLNNEQYQTVENAIATLKASRNLQAEKNPDLDGSALAVICETFLSSQPQADTI